MSTWWFHRWAFKSFLKSASYKPRRQFHWYAGFENFFFTKINPSKIITLRSLINKVLFVRLQKQSATVFIPLKVSAKLRADFGTFANSIWKTPFGIKVYIRVTIFSIGESIETPKPLKRKKCARLKKQPSCPAASVIFYDVLPNLEAKSECKILSDLVVIWTCNLLIWSQTHHHCATTSTVRCLRSLCNVDFGYCQVSASFRNNISMQCFLNETILLQTFRVVIQAFALAVDFVTSYRVMKNSLL